MNDFNQRKKAIILGAGPVGLVTAWELLKNDWCVSIYEKINIVGGMCRTWEWDDFYVDTGPHIFHTPDQNLASFREKEFGDLFVKGEFWCKNVRGCAQIAYMSNLISLPNKGVRLWLLWLEK